MPPPEKFVPKSNLETFSAVYEEARKIFSRMTEAGQEKYRTCKARLHCIKSLTVIFQYGSSQLGIPRGITVQYFVIHHQLQLLHVQVPVSRFSRESAPLFDFSMTVI